MKKQYQKGFTLAELLIVVAIIGVLVAISIPMFTSQLEKSREAVDLANVRSAYAQVMAAAIVEDTSSPLYVNGEYQMSVPLKQTIKGWTMDEDKLVIGGISKNAPQVEGKQPQWRGTPRPNGRCRVSVSEGTAYIYWGEDHINSVSAADFLTKDILEKALGTSYGYTVINSNEKYEQNGGTQKFLDYAKKYGFDLVNDYGAATWQIYVKGSDSGPFLQNPAIYWSTVKLDNNMVPDNGKKTFVPVIGFRNGNYDVYYAEVVKYNPGGAKEYLSIKNNFANVQDGENGLGGSATFQFDSYEKAKEKYDELMERFQKNGTITATDISDLKL